MKRNSLTLIIGALLVLVFGALLFSFQVRQTEIALVTTFGKPTRSINTDPEKPEPGWRFKLPWPRKQIRGDDHRRQNKRHRHGLRRLGHQRSHIVPRTLRRFEGAGGRGT
jgi:regulator of protease activity HflC (stomatin/prohibitin superfamily)